jgi:hypothetical protein
MRKKTLSLLAILGGLMLWGCYPNGPTYTEDLDLVLTHHNADYDFAAKSTYAMPNKIVKITGNVQQGELPEYIKDVYATQILQTIADNMESLGWTKVDLDANPAPDVLLTPAAWETTTITYYYDYWYWWWGGYYPYYPYYPPVYGYSYTTGTLLMNIIDPTQTGANDHPIPQWTGALNGVMNDVYNNTRVSRLIDQAFAQSPYLKTN